jgi:3-phenylpropionate/cinnamic acid dioxygenase small subunit
MSDDADAIRNLLYRYAECIDAADFAGLLRFLGQRLRDHFEPRLKR